MSRFFNEETMRYQNIEEGMRIQSWRGVADKVYFTAKHWNKDKPLLSDGDPPDPLFQWLQVEDENGELYWLRSYPSWTVIE
jgi:hypothetical protein